MTEALYTLAYLVLVACCLLSAAFIFLPLRLGLRTHGMGIQMIIATLLLIPASQLSLEVMNTLIVRFFPPRALPKMDFRVSGIPDACRTLVVVPMMLVDQETIKGEAEKLEIRYLANKEANLLFGLYSDYKDAARPHCDADAALLQAATESIVALNQRHGGGRFFLFHRDRESFVPGRSNVRSSRSPARRRRTRSVWSARRSCRPAGPCPSATPG